jgi:hypothetical protein
MAFAIFPVRMLPPQGTWATEPSTPWPACEGCAWSRLATGMLRARERAGTGGEEDDR